MLDFTHKLRRILGSLLMGFAILVLLIGTAVLYVGAWFAGSPFKVSVEDLSTEDLKKYYREQMDRDKEGP
ncbi:hypothetical protein N2382_09285 [SAR92 clade bacterium H921]|nr:hypothetical protein [SAR92 clade bacterium H921]